MNANTIDKVSAGLSGATSILGTALDAAKIKDTNAEQSIIDDLASKETDLGNYDSLEQLFTNTSFANTGYNWKDVRGMNEWQMAGSALGATAQGAMTGLQVAGPWGALGGAVVGLGAGLGGIFTGNAKAKKEANRLNYAGDMANKTFVRNFENSSRNIAMNSKNEALLNIAAYGGHVPTGNFTNGMTFFSEGGNHEENPYQGVLQGVAPDGKPNLVEEGEWKYKDYIYSKRLKVPKKDYEMLGLKEVKEYTYADAAEAILKESEERPNDPISKRNLDVMMGRLLNSLETFKLKIDVIKMKKEFEKLSPEELAYMIQVMNQPQQAIPVQAQYAANGGHLFSGNLSGTNKLFTFTPENWSNTKPDEGVVHAYRNGLYYIMPEDFNLLGTYDNLRWDESKKRWNVIEPQKLVEPNDTVQALRAVPILGSAVGALTSLFDKPDYSNIERAENMYRQIPMVSPKPIGNKMTYTPMDINYLMTQVGNLNIGNRRAIIESSAGNPGAVASALLASNYKGTTAMGEAFRQANEYNLKNQQLVEEFNRGTDMYNSEADFKGQTQNQSRAANIAEAFLKTGQLKDMEKATVQSNRSKALSNLFTSIGDLGTDKLNREEALAMAQSLGVTYNDRLNMFSKSILGGPVKEATGGMLRKKGGKHA